MLTIRHIAGDCGNTITGNSFDKVAVLNNGDEVAIVDIKYHPDSFATTATIVCRDEAAMIPRIFGDFHLLSLVMSTMIAAFNDSHEFYCDVFTDEDGNLRDLTIAV